MLRLGKENAEILLCELLEMNLKDGKKSKNNKMEQINQKTKKRESKKEKGIIKIKKE